MCGAATSSPCRGQNRAAIDATASGLAARQAILIFMGNVQILIGTLAAATLAILLMLQYAKERSRRALEGEKLFGPLRSLLENADLQRGQTAGIWTLTDHRHGHVFQLKTVADTLALRKLPSLWLMVTMPQAQPVTITTDLMMRAVGGASFASFEVLPHTLPLPGDFPVDATIRSDSLSNTLVLPLLARHLDLFHHGKGKEFLVSPKGLRIVLQVAEGDRTRYGVLREANFGDVSIDPALAIRIMDTLIALQEDLRQ
jgi:hypothetical protein